MTWLEVADLVIIASRTLELDTGQVLDLLDPAAAEAALAQMRSGDPEDPARQAAAVLQALVDRRPLRRGNQQVALAAMLQFLALNGWEVDPEPPEATSTVVAELSVGALDIDDVVDWLAPRLRLIDRAATCAKETPMRRWKPLTAIGIVTRRAQPKGLFQRFTDRARRAVHLAQEEARLLRHNYIGTEHLLLGLIREGEGVAAQVLARFDADHARLREQVLRLVSDDCEEPGAPTRLVRVNVPADLVEAAERLAEVRQHKEAAFEAGDLDRAGMLRDQEKQLLADKLRLERQLIAGVDVQTVIAENQRAHREIERLRELLRQHGIDPNGGNARTA